MGKGAYIKRMVAVINYNANSIMEKKQIGEDGGGEVKDMEFPKVKQKN